MQLRLPSACVLDDPTSLTLEILTPFADIEEYKRQQPLRIDGRVVWHRNQGDTEIYGVEFKQVTGEQRARIERCFSYFNKSMRAPMKSDGYAEASRQVSR